MRALMQALWTLLDPPPAGPPPIVERHPDLPCGSAVAQAWIDLTQLSRVLRARLAANEAARRAGRAEPHRHDPPEWPQWCPWRPPVPRPVEPQVTR